MPVTKNIIEIDNSDEFEKSIPSMDKLSVKSKNSQKSPNLQNSSLDEDDVNFELPSRTNLSTNRFHQLEYEPKTLDLTCK